MIIYVLLYILNENATYKWEYIYFCTYNKPIKDVQIGKIQTFWPMQVEELRCLRCRLEGGGEAEAQRMLDDFTVPQRQFLRDFFWGGWEKNGGNIQEIQEMMDNMLWDI